VVWGWYDTCVSVVGYIHRHAHTNLGKVDVGLTGHGGAG
jgi:hypothetical protein